MAFRIQLTESLAVAHSFDAEMRRAARLFDLLLGIAVFKKAFIGRFAVACDFNADPGTLFGGMILPYAHGIVRIQRKRIVRQNAAVLVGRIHVKYEYAAGLQKQRCTAQSAFKFVHRADVIEGVERCRTAPVSGAPVGAAEHRSCPVRIPFPAVR